MPLDGRASRPTTSHPRRPAHASTGCTSGARPWSLASHLGRPKGRSRRLRLAPVGERLAELLGRAGDGLRRAAPGELAAERSTCSRTCASTRARRPTTRRSSGRLVEARRRLRQRRLRRVAPRPRLASCRTCAASGRPARRRPPAAARGRGALGALRSDPKRPFVAVLGGAKVSRQARRDRGAARRVDALLIGGGMCFTFLAAQGGERRRRLRRARITSIEVRAAVARAARTRRADRHCRSDIVAAKRSTTDAGGAGAPLGDRSPTAGWASTSAPEPSAAFADVIADARPSSGTARWGCSSDAVRGRHARASPRRWPTREAFTVVGRRRLRSRPSPQFGLDDAFDHVSTGGGASLELLEGGDLPGLDDPGGVHRMTERRSRSSRQLEDASQPLRGHPDGPEAVLPRSTRTTTSGSTSSIHPPFTDLRSVQTLIEADKLPFGLGAQHCHREEKGAFTGEVSPPMLAKLEVRYVIVGHSERRELFGETDEIVNRKVAGRVRPRDDADRVRRRDARGARGRRAPRPRSPQQVRRGVRRASSAEAGRAAVIAYEPIWAIGTGRNAEPAGRRPGRRRSSARPWPTSYGDDGGRRPSASSTAAA